MEPVQQLIWQKSFDLGVSWSPHTALLSFSADSLHLRVWTLIGCTYLRRRRQRRRRRTRRRTKRRRRFSHSSLHSPLQHFTRTWSTGQHVRFVSFFQQFLAQLETYWCVLVIWRTRLLSCDPSLTPCKFHISVHHTWDNVSRDQLEKTSLSSWCCVDVVTSLYHPAAALVCFLWLGSFIRGQTNRQWRSKPALTAVLSQQGHSQDLQGKQGCRLCSMF